jgi:hypothetical protein
MPRFQEGQTAVDGFGDANATKEVSLVRLLEILG